TRNWHFGDGVGLRFDPDTIYKVQTSIQTHEAAAVHTDQDGNLLLYSNGETIWNANHEIIHNGNLALGHHSSNLGSVFVFHEDNPDSIYLFNTYYNISTTKEFSVNLIVREADTFRVAYKDSVLMYSVCEPIAVVKADNGRDIWVVVHEFGANNLYSYLLTSQGIVSCPVVSKSFSTPFGSPQAAFFTMVFSSDGSYMAKVNTNQTFPLIKRVETYRFHSGNGKFDFLYSLDSLAQLTTGLCFNKDNSYLFVTERDDDLLSFKFNPNDSLSTINSKNKIALSGLKSKLQQMPYNYGVALMRRRPDDVSFIDFIVNDDLDTIKVLEEKIDLNATMNYVFPNFNQSYFYTPPINFTDKTRFPQQRMIGSLPNKE
ncbi:MAG: hypothetical protein LC109_03345, partial [Bacteroidia bacterium]|nr:hypothetical protein [Bacteroidia bacterium]